MDPAALTKIIMMCSQLDQWCKSSANYCPLRNQLDEYKNTSALLKACGRDNKELDTAITAADQLKPVNVVARCCDSKRSSLLFHRWVWSR